MSSSFEQGKSPQVTTAEELAAMASGVIVRASRLHSPSTKDRKDELHAGPGYLSRLQKLDGGTVNVGVTSREAEGKFPARTMVLKETGLGVLIVAVEEKDDAMTVEGTFATKEAGIGVVELDGDRAVSAATTVLSALDHEITKRDDAYFEAFLEG